MNILVDRITSDNNATLSVVYIDGEFSCFGLEDEYRAHKIPAETRIPSGKYKIGVRREGGFHEKYNRRFPLFHVGMLEVLSVLNFTNILIHIGNTDDDTAGCLLIGGIATTTSGLGLSSSTNSYKTLYNQCIEAAIEGLLFIEYRDNDNVEPT
jgi:hypothetical protein